MPPLNAIVIGVGVLIMIEAVLGMIFGIGYRDFPAAFSTQTYAVGGVALFSPQDVFTVVSVLVADGRPGAAVHLDAVRAADAGRRVRARGGPPARRPGRAAC